LLSFLDFFAFFMSFFFSQSLLCGVGDNFTIVLYEFFFLETRFFTRVETPDGTRREFHVR
jgi:hypothetical protein